MHRHDVLRLTLLGSLALAAASCEPAATPTTPLPSASAMGSASAAPPPTAATPTALPVPKTVSVGELEVRRSGVQPSIGAYTIGAGELANLAAMQKAMGGKLSSSAVQQLTERGFVLLPWTPPSHPPDATHDARFGGRIDDMVDLLGEVSGPEDPANRRPEHAVFITTDVLLHTYHVLLDRAFQRIEEHELQPRLREMTLALFKATARGTTKSTPEPSRKSFERLSAYLLVPLAILEAAPREPTAPPPVWMEEDDPDAPPKPAAPPDSKRGVLAALQKHRKEVSPDAFAAARAELELVMAASRPASSPLWSEVSRRVVDYTQFTPRSHYTRNAILRSYFRAMMWYGLRHFALESPELTRDALELTRLMATVGSGPSSPREQWQTIYEPTSFYVGASDDGTFSDYQTIGEEVFGGPPARWTVPDATKLEAFCQKASTRLPQPRVRGAAFTAGSKPSRWRKCRPAGLGLRMMGQRYIPDSYFFTRLTSGAGLPSTPTALMIMGILGSAQADGLLDGWLTTNRRSARPQVEKIMGELKSEVAELEDRVWGSTLYYGWLFALRPLLGGFDEGYPMFMRGDDWSRKGLLAALGSWTELRHDTLLYAKQSGAEKAGGDAERKIPPAPKGYVEPNLEFFARLSALARMTREGLTRRGLLDERRREPFEALERALEFCTRIAEQELSNQTISDDDYEELRTLHLDLRWALMPLDADFLTERDARAALVADVHTDAMTSRILYEATGAPMQILVAVKDQAGARVTRGTVYSYYEFTEPVGKRLTVEQWQQRIYGSGGPALPAAPSWVRQMTAGE